MGSFICANCKKPFNRTTDSDYCPDCESKENERFQVIKDYLTEHPGATMMELVNNLGFTVSQIRHYMREERLEIIGATVASVLSCEKCGLPIRSGRFCDSCYREHYSKDLQKMNEAARNARAVASDVKDATKIKAHEVRFKSTDKK